MSVVRAGITAALLAACASPPAVTLPVDRSSRVPALRGDPGAPAGELEVEPLELEGIRGGRIVFSLPGRPEQVARMLLDFEDAAGHRAWAEEYETVSRDEDGAVARWHLAGRLGIHPTIELEHRIERRAEPIVISFRQRRGAFGLAAFFGDYRIWSADAATSYLAERVFIDSGLPFANASAADIAAGLREDAARMRAWMAERLERRDGAAAFTRGAATDAGARPPSRRGTGTARAPR